MTKANRTMIKDRILDLKTKIDKQKKELQFQIEQKTRRFENLLDNDLNKESKNIGMVSTGALALLMILDVIRKGHTVTKLQESLYAEKLLANKANVVEKLYNQVIERLNIISTAESKDLTAFLKDNDVYSVFEKDTFEKFLDKEKNIDKVKEKDKNNIFVKNSILQPEREVSNGR